MHDLKVITSDDGSSTIFNEDKNETYHSRHGAIQESMHVFIMNGLLQAFSGKQHLNILEVGLGTGLNALLTIQYLQNSNKSSPGKSINYVGIEPYPLHKDYIDKLNYCQQPDLSHLSKVFNSLHTSGSNLEITFLNNFTFRRDEVRLQEFETAHAFFDLVYFDAFSPAAEPDLWTDETFSKLRLLMRSGGILVTYCSKGDVRRSLQRNSFSTERLKGPPGKHEMLRATAI